MRFVLRPLLLIIPIILPLFAAPLIPPSPDRDPPRGAATRRPPAPTATVIKRPLPASAHVPVLMYHYVEIPPPNAERLRRDLTTTPEEFEAQLQFLSDNGYTTISLDQLYDYLSLGDPLPAKPVVLTFDDGYLDIYTEVFPLLRRFGMIGTFFIVTDFINYHNPEHASWPMVQEMASAGMNFEPHSRTHMDLRGRSTAVLVWELLGPVEQITAYTGHRPRFFCYPAGNRCRCGAHPGRSANRGRPYHRARGAISSW